MDTTESTEHYDAAAITRDELLALLIPAALTGPPGLAEKLLAYHRIGRYDNFILPEHAFASDEREFIRKALVECHQLDPDLSVR